MTNSATCEIAFVPPLIIRPRQIGLRNAPARSDKDEAGVVWLPRDRVTRINNRNRTITISKTLAREAGLA